MVTIFKAIRQWGMYHLLNDTLMSGNTWNVMNAKQNSMDAEWIGERP